MKIGLYFGSFNPIHLAHIALAQHLVNEKLADEVWLVVSPHNPLKDNSALLEAKARLEMTRIAVQDHPHLKVSDIEFQLPVPSYTIDTLQVLSDRYPENEFSLLIGSDNALIFHRWKNYEQLLDNYPIWVYPRRGYAVEKLAGLYPQMHILSTPYYDISSTQLRDAVKAGNTDFAKQHLDEEVFRYIEKNRLYRHR